MMNKDKDKKEQPSKGWWHNNKLVKDVRENSNVFGFGVLAGLFAAWLGKKK